MNILSLDPFIVNWGMGNLGASCSGDQGESPVSMVANMAKKGDCSGYQGLVTTYQRLAAKKDKKTEACALQFAAANQSRYNACVDRASTMAVQAAINPQAAALQAAGQFPGQSVPYQQASSSGISTTTILMIGGGILAIGLVIYLIRRK